MSAADAFAAIIGPYGAIALALLFGVGLWREWVVMGKTAQRDRERADRWERIAWQERDKRHATTEDLERLP